MRRFSNAIGVTGSRLAMMAVVLASLCLGVPVHGALDPTVDPTPGQQGDSGVASGLSGSVLTSLGVFTIGTNFTGSSVGQSGFIPPDTMGAVGPGHIVELINGRYAVYQKDGTYVSGQSLNSFWTDAGVTYAGDRKSVV